MTQRTPEEFKLQVPVVRFEDVQFDLTSPLKIVFCPGVVRHFRNLVRHD